MPTGPVQDIVGVVFTANGKTLPWTRDDNRPLPVPRRGSRRRHQPARASGLHRHHARLGPHRRARVGEAAALSRAHAGARHRHPAQRDRSLLVGEWNRALRPPSRSTPTPSPAEPCSSSLRTVEQLQDSPILTGEYFHEFPLAPDISPKHYIDVVSDQPGRFQSSPRLLDRISSLVREADSAYASHHYYLLPLPAHALRRRRRRGPGTRPVLGQRHRREGLLRHSPPARQRRPARARVHPLLER